MKVLVRQSVTGLFFKKALEWVPDPDQAMDFGDSLQAFDFCVRHHTTGELHILLLASDPDASVVINPAPELRLRRDNLPPPPPLPLPTTPPQSGPALFAAAACQAAGASRPLAPC